MHPDTSKLGQKPDQKKIRSTIPMALPKRNLKNSNAINVDSNETLPIPK